MSGIYYHILPSGFRDIPSGLLQSGQCLSTATVSYLEHNQSLIYQTMQGRQLVNQQFMEVFGGEDNYFAATPSGELIAVLPPYEYQPGFQILGKTRVKKRTSSYSDDTHLFFVSTPKIPERTQTTSGIVALNSGLNNSYTSVVVSNTDYEYKDFELTPNPGEGNEFYLSMWADSPTDSNAECYITSLSIWEEDVID